jgi:nitrite reductase/ring-hydroxylating ferredoxin subunit
MAMPADESVNSSLNPMKLPAENEICVVDVVIDGENTSIILHRRAQKLLAWRNVCPHQGRRLDYVPGKFLRDGDLLICAAHGACFSLENGECVAGPCRGERLSPVAWPTASATAPDGGTSG